MRRFAVQLCVSALVLTFVTVGFAADAKVRVFEGGMDQVFDATVKAVEKNWKKVRSADRPAATIQFHTGVSLTTWGEDCTAVLRDLGDGKIEVSLKSRNSAQLYAWGVGDRIAQKLFNSIQSQISTSSPGTPPSSAASSEKK